VAVNEVIPASRASGSSPVENVSAEVGLKAAGPTFFIVLPAAGPPVLAPA